MVMQQDGRDMVETAVSAIIDDAAGGEGHDGPNASGRPCVLRPKGPLGPGSGSRFPGSMSARHVPPLPALSTIQDMREKELKLLVIILNKSSRLDRSFAKANLSAEKRKQFREKLLDYSLVLIKKIDDATITNADIRQKIRALTAIDPRITYGQAQKVVNLFLKQYCFIANKMEALAELDCPYDIYKNNYLKIDEKEYVAYQNYLEAENDIKILKDSEYDEFRINSFLTIDE
jgi:hypothetical protein